MKKKTNIMQIYLFCAIRSRSLLKSRRISGRLYEIRVHPIQSLHSSSSQSAGKTLNKLFNICIMLSKRCHSLNGLIDFFLALFVFEFTSVLGYSEVH